MSYHSEGLDQQVLDAFGIDPAPKPQMQVWEEISHKIHNPEGQVKIAIVGKYTVLKDAYKSLMEALVHGGIANGVKVNLHWVESDIFDSADPSEQLGGVDGILVPGGFGERGAEGKIKAAAYAREHKIPYFGICYGMQMAVLDAARNLAGIEDATSSELDEDGKSNNHVVGLMTEWLKGNQLEKREAAGDMGGTMRLGAYPHPLDPDSHIAEIYGSTEVSERHRHRYEVNIDYKPQLEAAGLIFSGMSPDGLLPETIEYPRDVHPWFIGVQYHPELKSRPFDVHPLFASFIAAAKEQGRLV